MSEDYRCWIGGIDYGDCAFNFTSTQLHAESECDMCVGKAKATDCSNWRMVEAIKQINKDAK